MKRSNIKLNLLLLVLFIAVKAKCDEEVYRKIVIDPEVKYINSNGTIVSNKSRGSQNVFLRRAASCKLPQSSDTSQIVCKDYPNRMSCIQTCIFGYTLSEGIQREMKCNKEDNVWKPVPTFETCKPFVDCTVTLVDASRKECISNYLTRGPRCEISCFQVEDKPAVPKRTYVCDIEGKWTPQLPHCVRAGSGMQLVSAPKGTKQAFIGED